MEYLLEHKPLYKGKEYSSINEGMCMKHQADVIIMHVHNIL